MRVTVGDGIRLQFLEAGGQLIANTSHDDHSIFCHYQSNRYYDEGGVAENQSRASRRRSIETAMTKMMTAMDEITAMVGLNRNRASKLSNTLGRLAMANMMLIQRAQFFRLRATSHIQAAWTA